MMQPRRRRFLRASGTALALGPWVRRSWAAPWPHKLIRLWVTYPPGGVSDAVARLLAMELAALLGVSVIVENHPGASGTVGMAALSRAQPDGHTLAFSAISPLSLSPWMGAVRYDPWRDIVPVAAVMRTPVLVVATPAFPVGTLQDLVRVAARQPGMVRWASTGHGTVGHMVMQQVCAASATRITHIPYQGGGQQIAQALAGNFEVLSTNAVDPQLSLVQSGRLRALAVGAPSRLPSLLQVATLQECGYPQANLVSLFGLFAPAGISPPVIGQLNAAVNQALQSSTLRGWMRDNKVLPAGGTVQSFVGAIREDSARNGRLLQSIS